MDNYSGQGKYPVYSANGVIGYTSISNTGQENTTLIINRVGNYAGRIYLTERKCFVTDNAMYVMWLSDKIFIEFLYLLRRNRNLNKLKTGSAQPYITKQTVLDYNYKIPPLHRQKNSFHQ